MSESVKLGVMRYQPSKVLVVYDTVEHNSSFIECMDVDASGRLLASHPLTEQESKRVGKALLAGAHGVSRIRFDGLVPRSVLHFAYHQDEVRLVWTVPSQMRRMVFDRALEIASGAAWQQDLIFSLTGDALQVFGYRPEELAEKGECAQLYLPLYHNVSNKGDVCLGAAGVSKKMKAASSLNERMAIAGRAFFDSCFTHGNSELTDRFDFNINNFWSDQITTSRPFPESAYLPIRGYTIKKLIA
jgi:PRTRC genetic system protein B